MAEKRPTAITVMGILNVILGSLSLVGSFCGGVSIIMNSSGAQVGGAGPGQDISGQRMWKLMVAEVPGFVAFEYSSLLLGIALGSLLLLSGIGLLNMRSWGRTLALLYVPVKIVFEVASLIYTMVLVNPVQARWMQAELARGAGKEAEKMGGIMGAVFGVVAVLSAAVAIAYAIVLLIMMFRPSVREAFFPGSRPLGLEPVAPDEGDEYERKRRSPWDY